MTFQLFLFLTYVLSHTNLGTETPGGRDLCLRPKERKRMTAIEGCKGLCQKLDLYLDCALGPKLSQQNEDLSQGLNLEGFHVRGWIAPHKRP